MTNGSLAGLDPKDALRALLKLDPDAEPIDADDPENHPQP